MSQDIIQSIAGYILGAVIAIAFASCLITLIVCVYKYEYKVLIANKDGERESEKPEWEHSREL